MQVKIIVITLGRIWKWSLNTGGLLIEVVFKSGLTVPLMAMAWCMWALLTVCYICVCVCKQFFSSKISQELLNLGFWNLVQTLGITVVLCKRESASSCLSFPSFVHFSFSPIKISVTNFLASTCMWAKVFRFCIHCESGIVYCGKENQYAEIIFCLHFPFFLFSISHSSVIHREICVEDFSGTTASRIFKFGTNFGYD